MNTEQETHIALIDVALKKAGWNVDDPGHVVQEYDILVDPLQVAEACTATPTDVIDHNTFKLFACKDSLPTFAYTYEEAVNSTPPYLCDFQVMKIQTKFQKEGISKRTISAEHTNLNSRQLEFLRLLKDFIIEREKVKKRDLIQSPFTIIHPQGIRGVFRPAEIDEILQLTEQLAA